MKKSKILELPSITSLSTKKGMKEFKEKYKNVNINNEEEVIKIIELLIWQKMNSTNKEIVWTVKEYREFKNSFLDIDDKTFELLSSSIIKCLKTLNSEIYKELKLFSNEVDWYPRLIKDKNTNKYIVKEITPTDCFYILDSLARYIKQYEYNYVLNIADQVGEIDNILNIIKSNQEKISLDFDNKFKFLINYTLFIDIYIQEKSDLLNNLIEKAYLINATNNMRKEQKNKSRTSSYDAKTRTLSKIYDRKYNSRYNKNYY